MKLTGKSSKGIVCIGVAVLLSLTMFVGCTNSSTSATEPSISASNTDANRAETSDKIIEIDFWHNYASGEGAKLMTSLIANFEKEHPNMKVKELGLAFGEQDEKIIPALAAGTAPDIFVFDLSTVKARAMNGQLMNLDSYVKAESLDVSKFFPATLDACMYNGELYGLPYMTDTRVLYYNKEHFREAGLDPENPPKSWDELLECVKKLTIVNEKNEVERVGMSLNVFELAPWTMGWTFGAELWNKDGTPNINSPEMLEALNFVLKLQDTVGLSAYESLNEESAISGVSPFVNETCSMCVQWNGLYNDIKTYNPELDFGVTYIPTKDGKNYKSSWGAGSSIEFSYHDEARAQAAFELGMYLTSPKVASQFIQNTSDFVCNMDAYNDPAVQSDPVWQFFAKNGEITRMHYFCPELPTWHSKTLLPEWQAAIAGSKTPAQTLEDTQNIILQEIENYKKING